MALVYKVGVSITKGSEAQEREKESSKLKYTYFCLCRRAIKIASIKILKQEDLNIVI